MQIWSLVRCVIVLPSAFSLRDYMYVLLENSASPAHSPLLSRSIHPSIHPDINSAPRTIWLFVMRAALICMRISLHIPVREREIYSGLPSRCSARILFTCRARAQHEQYQNTGLIKAHYASAWNAKHPASSHRVRSALMQRFWLYHPIAISSASPTKKRDVHVL